MKTPNFLFLTTILLLSGTIDGRTTAYIIGLSPCYALADRDTVFRSVMQFTLEGIALGDQVIIYDALNQQPVTQFTLPQEALLQRNARARAQRLRAEIAAVQRFLTGDRVCSTELTGVLHVPEFLALAGAQLRKPGEMVQVILIGSPFYVNTNEPAYNMAEAVVSDAHIIADQGQTLFGTANKVRLLQGTTVHYAYLHDAFINSYHMDRTRRFWCLFVQTIQEGTLATFAANVNLAFERAQNGVQQSCVAAQLDPNESKIEMRRVVRGSPPPWLVATAEVRNFPAARTPSNTGISAFPVSSTAGKIGIGIMWKDRVDLDLWVKATPRSRELSYQTSITAEGRYFHDYRDANAGLDYEYVELKDGLDLDLRQVRCFVNIFEGRAPAVSGTVVLHYRGNTFQSAFTIRATSGNHGADYDRREKSPYWVELDLARLANLAPSPTADQSSR